MAARCRHHPPPPPPALHLLHWRAPSRPRAPCEQHLVFSAALPPQRCRLTRCASQPPRHLAAQLAVVARYPVSVASSRATLPDNYFTRASPAQQTTIQVLGGYRRLVTYHAEIHDYQEGTPRRTLGDRRAIIKEVVGLMEIVGEDRGRERAREMLTARGSRLTPCDAAPSGGEGRRRRGSVSGDAIRRGDEETQEARRAARQADTLQRGAERGREEAEEGQHERRWDVARRRLDARGTARDAVNSRAATRRRAAGGGGRGAGRERPVLEERHRANTRDTAPGAADS